MIRALPLTIVETPEFLSAAHGLLDDAERVLLVDYLASNPTGGDLIPRTGGVRKLRWRLTGRGKRGGARIIYFYHNPRMPLFLLTAYAKNQRSDLSQAERNDFRHLTLLLVNSFGRNNR